MSTSKPILLLFGNGPRTGAKMSTKFAEAGYHVAATGRKVVDGVGHDGILYINMDLEHPEGVAGAFEKVKKQFGAAPNCIVWNAVAWASVRPANPFTVPVERLEQINAVNITSLWAAVCAAVEGFATLPDSVPKSFIGIGNMLNDNPVPNFVTLGIGKAAMAHIIECGEKAYKDRGYRFYYVDERVEGGSPAGENIDGDAHGELSVELAKSTEQLPWAQTFIKGKGYVKFY